MIKELSFLLLTFSSIFTILMLFFRTLKGESNGYFFVIPVFILFYVVPVIIDNLVGLHFLGPAYSFTIYAAMEDNYTGVFYNIYITCVLLFFYWQSGRKTIKKASRENENISFIQFQAFIKRRRLLLWIVIFLPLFFAVLSGDVSFYSTYSERARHMSSPLQNAATKAVIISMPVIVLLLTYYVYRTAKLSKHSNLIPIFILVTLSLVNIYIHGKRSIVAILILLLIVSFFYTKVIGRKALFAFLFFIIALFVSFLIFYGKNITDADGLIQIYQGLRIDFSRDYSLKFVIFHELLNDNKVLPYMGASYLFLLLFFIPRAVWLAKPYPYAVYFTNSAFGDFGEANLYGWGLTTSFVTEAISNLGYLGLLAFPLFYSFFMFKIEKIKPFGTRMLGLLIMISLLVIHPIAIMIMVLLLFLLLLNQKFKFKILAKVK